MKPTILGIKRENNSASIKFNSDQAFIPLFLQLKKELHLNWEVFQYNTEENTDLKTLTIEEVADLHEHYKDEHLNIHLFLGTKRIILYLETTTTTLLEQIMNIINTNSEWFMPETKNNSK